MRKKKSMWLSIALLAVTGIVAALYSTKVIELVKKVPMLADIDTKIGDNAA